MQIMLEREYIATDGQRLADVKWLRPLSAANQIAIEIIGATREGAGDQVHRRSVGQEQGNKERGCHHLSLDPR